MKITNYEEATASLTLRYRNEIAFKKRGYAFDKTRIRMSHLITLLEYARTIQDYGYYIDPNDLLTLMCVDFDDTTALELNTTFAAVIQYLCEAKGAQYTYHTLFGVDHTAYDLIKEGIDPYFVQYVHYAMTSQDYTYLDEALVKQAPTKEDEPVKKVEEILHTHSEDDLEKNIGDMINDLIHNIDGKERLTICYDADKEATDIFIELIGSNNPMSATMKQDVDSYLQFVGPALLEETTKTLVVPCKETLAYLINEFIKYGYHADMLKGNINNATDVLRAFAIYSNPEYDGSLSSAPRFKNHLRAEETRFFMTLLTHADHVETDVFMYPEYWKRAFERIKPQRCLGKQYEKIRKAADNLRKNKKPQTVNGIAERLIAHAGDSLKDFESGLKQLENFPGVYMRKFDKYVRTYGSRISDDVRENRHFQLIVSQSLHRVLPQVESTKMLCNLLLMYQRRVQDKTNNRDGLRYAKPKGKRSYVPLKPIPEKLCDDAYLLDFYKEIANILTQEITRRFKDLPYMGKVFIDPLAAGFVVPTELREANDSGMHIVGRGSYMRFPMVDDYKDLDVHDVIIPYIHWTNLPNGGRVDIDLSASFYEADWTKVPDGHCWYRNLVVAKDGKMIATHSGDYTTGGPSDGEGVSEYIIVRRKEAVERLHAKYMVVTTHCYTQQAFKEATTFFGFEYVQEKDGDRQLETLSNMRLKPDTLHAVIQPDRTIFTSNIQTDESSIINVVIDLEQGIMWYADIATQATYGDTEYKISSKILDEAKDNTDGESKYKALINAGGNNILATEVSAMAQIKALFEKPTLYCGDLIWLHTQVRGYQVYDIEKADVVFTIPTSPVIKKVEEDQDVITPFMVDRIVNELLPVK